MKTKFIIMLIINGIILLVPVISLPAIYETITSSGNVIFSDKPSPCAKTIKLQETNKLDNTNIKNAFPSAKIGNNKISNSNEKYSVIYEKFVLISPKNEEVFHNQGQIQLKLAIMPGLQTSDKIQIYIDGKLYVTERKSSIMLENLDRGAHEIQAKLIDRNDNILKSTPVITVYIHYTSI